MLDVEAEGDMERVYTTLRVDVTWAIAHQQINFELKTQKQFLFILQYANQ